jgi:hypothetical protein
MYDTDADGGGEKNLARRDVQGVGNDGAPGTGGVAPAAYVDATGDGVPAGMPDVKKGSGGTPFVPDGTGTTGVGNVVVADDTTDPEPAGVFGDAVAGVEAELAGLDDDETG